MKCNNCGYENKPNDNYCAECGAQLKPLVGDRTKVKVKTLVNGGAFLAFALMFIGAYFAFGTANEPVTTSAMGAVKQVRVSNSKSCIKTDEFTSRVDLVYVGNRVNKYIVQYNLNVAKDSIELIDLENKFNALKNEVAKYKNEVGVSYTYSNNLTDVKNLNIKLEVDLNKITNKDIYKLLNYKTADLDKTIAIYEELGYECK